MFCIVLAMDISFISLHLLQRDELWGHSWLTAPAAAPSDPVWHLARPHFPRLHVASDWAQQGCQNRAMFTGCETLPMDSLDMGTPISLAKAFSELCNCLKFFLCIPFSFFSFYRCQPCIIVSMLPGPTPAPSLYPSKPFSQSISYTSTSVLVSSCQRTQTDKLTKVIFVIIKF